MNPNTPSNKKPIVIAVVAIVLAVGGWYFYKAGGNGSSTSDLVASGDADSGPTVGADVLAILRSVSSLKIDPRIFSSAVYQSLVDYSISVPPLPVGRPNPFAPTGSATPAPAAAH